LLCFTLIASWWIRFIHRGFGSDENVTSVGISGRTVAPIGSGTSSESAAAAPTGIGSAMTIMGNKNKKKA
jgi:hypothetical protein